MCFSLGTHGPGGSAGTQTDSAAHSKNKNSPALLEKKTLTEQGNLEAQNFLALVYRHGNGVPKHFKTLVKFFTRTPDDSNDAGQ